MQNKSKKTIFILIVSTIILSLTNFVGALPNLVVYATTSIAIIFKGGRHYLKSKGVLCLSAFYIILVLYGLVGYGTLSLSHYKALLYAIVSIYTAFLVSSYIDTLEANQIKKLLIISLVTLSLSLGIATFIATINPMAIRFSFGDPEKYGVLNMPELNFRGLMSYSQAHALSVISVGLCVLFCYVKKHWIKLFSFTLWLITIKLLFDMTITTALFVSVICCLFTVIHRFSKGNTIMSILLVFFLVMILLSGSIISDFLGFAETSNTVIFKKMEDLLSTIEKGSGQGQMQYRNYLYMTSFNTFLSNPVFGFGKDNGSRTIIGEHSFFLDYLAYYGLFALLYFCAWWIHYKTVVISRNINFKKVCLYSFVPVLLLIMTKAESVCGQLPFVSLVFLKIIFSYLKDENVMKKSI